MLNIYIMPTVENMPPRAVLINSEEEIDLSSYAGPALMAIWSRDIGTWMMNDMPLPADLAEAITEHTRELGVEW